MVELLKYLLKGLWTIVKLPFVVVCYALVLIYALFQYILLGFKSIGLFFSGRSIKDDDEKTIKLNGYKKAVLDRLNPLNQIK